MTTNQKSKSLWLLGAITGGVIGGLAGKSAKDTVLGTLMGAILVGGVGDSMLERDQNDQRLAWTFAARS